ncbi:MAG TPA: ATP-binding protein [Candidatus Limnocylindria bacterium]|nr:ATP-binding protein [Candidatus Limnocylindria bacterium]
MSSQYRRPIFARALERLREPRRFLQVLAGPRQVGKTTLAHQLAEALGWPAHIASADAPTLRDAAWLEQQWETGRALTRGTANALLVLDEIQKVTGWPGTVKRLWDEDSAAHRRLRVVLLGSTPLLVQHGLTESLAGRFELIRVWHWSYAEMRAAFGWDVDRYVYFGGYPGAAPLVKDEDRWAAYIRDSLIETTVSRDILLLARVDKPAVLRQLFGLACELSGQIVSYQKLVGQLQDAGNTTTLAHYLELLAGAGMVAGLQKYSGSRVRQRGSSPKLLALNTALISATSGTGFARTRADPERWGRLVESAVGAHLYRPDRPVQYWRESDREVDYVYRDAGTTVALEVASGRRKGSLPGVTALLKRYPRVRPMLVGAEGIPLERFLLDDGER